MAAARESAPCASGEGGGGRIFKRLKCSFVTAFLSEKMDNIRFFFYFLSVS